MGLNLDKETDYTPWGTKPTPEELVELNNAKYIVRQIGKAEIHGYSDSRERALGWALEITMTTMLQDGMVIDVRDSDRQIELRISEDRKSTIVQWLPAPQEQPTETT